uniref:Modifier of mdg4 n=1 Tax=Pararge aegeria TaxID=116150 RepID=S4PU22_9NEOP
MIRFATGKVGFLFQKYTYCKQKTIRNGSRWVCSRSNYNKCRVYLHLDNENKVIFQIPLPHTHPPPKILPST